MRVVLVDNHRSFREALALALTQRSPFEVVGEASTAREARLLVEAKRPDLVVAALTLRDSDGISLIHELRRKTTARIMILTMHGSGLFAREAFDAGAQGYVSKEQSLTEVFEAMLACARGDRYLSPLVELPPTSDRPAPASRASAPTLMERLSRREREIFLQAVRGNSSKAIARLLCISLKTVETHRAHINRKLGIRSPAELIRLAAMKGLLAGQVPVSTSPALGS